MDPEVYYHVHKSQPLVPVLDQIDLSMPPAIIFLEVMLIVIL
jgi:hypothetical protein